MSDSGMLIEMADRLFADRIDDATIRGARAGAWPAALWDAVAEMGLPLALVDEAAGGFGVATGDALALVRLAARRAAPLPLAETMLANRVLGAAGLPLAEGPAALIDGAGLAIDRDSERWAISGTAARVPFGRNLSTLVVVAGGRVYRLAGGWAVSALGENLAGMPRDTLAITARGVRSGVATGVPPLLAMAAIRSIEIAGALERVLEMTIEHVSDRVQFGRNLAKFQAVQHELARLGGEVAAGGAAADLAGEALAGDAASAPLAIAAARVRAGEAASIAVAIAQQLHGAIGFTVEHRLHWFTTALWSWRDEGGSQRHWTDLLGRAAIGAGGSDYWAFVTEVA